MAGGHKYVVIKDQDEEEEDEEEDLSDLSEGSSSGSRTHPLVAGWRSVSGLVLDSRDTITSDDEHRNKKLCMYYQRLERLPKRLPLGRWPKDVIAISQKYAAKGTEPVPLGMVCGPAVQDALRNIKVQILYFIGMMFGGWFFQGCSPDGFGQPPVWWPLTLLPVVTVSLLLEMRAMQYVLVPLLQVVKGLNFPMPFRSKPLRLQTHVWLCFQFGMSCLNIVNIANICNFTMRVMFVNTCALKSANKELSMNHIWKGILSQSMAFSPIGDISLQWIACLFWALSFSPYLQAVLKAVPLLAEDVSYDVCVDATPKGKVQYDTCLSRGMNHGTALGLLAEACGMSTCVSSSGLSYARNKSQMQWGSEADPAWPIKCVKHAEGQCERSTIRTFFAGTMKNALQLNLQITVYICRRVGQVAIQQPRQVMPEMLFAFAISILSVCNILNDAKNVLKFSRQTLTDIKVVLKDLEAEASPEDEDQWQKLVALSSGVKTLWRAFSILVVLTFLCWLLVTYAVCKLVMSFVCPSAAWNLNGCVILPSEANLTHFVRNEQPLP